MNFYRYQQTLGESSNAIVAQEKRRALQREIAAEAIIMLGAAIIALVLAVRLLHAGTSLAAPVNELLTALQGWL